MAMKAKSTDRRQDFIHHQAEAMAAKLPPLLVAAERVAATVSQGAHGRRRVGQGETFWQFRRYQPGDSATAIDWRQSAKSAPVYVRETELAAAASVWLWFDSSPSMHYCSKPGLQTKAERAALMALALASLLMKGGERVALLGSSQPPACGHVFLERLAGVVEESLAQQGKAAASLPAPEGLRERLPSHARIVLIGDFLSPLPEVAAVMAAFAGSDGRGHLLQVLDPAEETLPFTGRMLLRGLEGEADILIQRAETLCGDYQAAIARRHDALLALARRAGWSFACHLSDRPPEMALLALFMALSESSGCYPLDH